MCQALVGGRGDTLDLIHVVDPATASADHSPAHIKHQCELKTKSGMHAAVSAEFHAEDRLESGVITTIINAAEARHADLLLVGATGLKIEAGEKHADSFSVMGSTSAGPDR